MNVEIKDMSHIKFYTSNGDLFWNNLINLIKYKKSHIQPNRIEQVIMKECQS